MDVADLEQRVARPETNLDKLTSVVTSLASTAEIVVNQVQKLAEAQQRAEERLEQLTLKLHETDEKLDALIQVVDDFIRRQPRPEA